MAFADSYYSDLCAGYQARRDFLLPVLQDSGFKPYMPHGAYYTICDISDFGFKDDVGFTRFLVEQVGVAVVPGSSFYSEPRRGAQQVRFAFSKRLETLDRVAPRLLSVKDRVASLRS